MWDLDIITLLIATLTNTEIVPSVVYWTFLSPWKGRKHPWASAPVQPYSPTEHMSLLMAESPVLRDSWATTAMFSARMQVWGIFLPPWCSRGVKWIRNETSWKLYVSTKHSYGYFSISVGWKLVLLPANSVPTFWWKKQGSRFIFFFFFVGPSPKVFTDTDLYLHGSECTWSPTS